MPVLLDGGKTSTKPLIDLKSSHIRYPYWHSRPTPLVQIYFIVVTGKDIGVK